MCHVYASLWGLPAKWRLFINTLHWHCSDSHFKRMSLQSPSNTSFKPGSRDPSALLPELYNEYPLPTPSSIIVKAPGCFATALFNGVPARYPPSSDSGRSGSAADAAAVAAAAAPSPSSPPTFASICIQISIHPTSPNTIQLSIFPPLPPPPQRLPWIKADANPPAAAPFISLCAPVTCSIIHHPLLNCIEIFPLEQLKSMSSLSSPLTSPNPPNVFVTPPSSFSLHTPPSSLALHLASFDDCIRVCKALCHSLMTRSAPSRHRHVTITSANNSCCALHKPIQRHPLHSPLSHLPQDRHSHPRPVVTCR